MWFGILFVLVLFPLSVGLEEGFVWEGFLATYIIYGIVFAICWTVWKIKKNAKEQEEKSWFKDIPDGTKVKIDFVRIRSKENYASTSEKYKDFVFYNKDKIFTARRDKYGQYGMICLEENGKIRTLPDYSMKNGEGEPIVQRKIIYFHSDELIVVKEGGSNE